MNSTTKLKIMEVMRELNNQPLIYGEQDCNLMVLKMFEPEKYELLLGRYSTVVGGARVANKVFGFTRIDDYMEEREEYERIQATHIQFGDIIFSDIDRVAMVAISSNVAFAIEPTSDKFTECTIKVPDTYKIFRRTQWNPPQS